MARTHPDRKAFHSAVRKHIRQLLASGITRFQLQEALGVTKQAISSYVTGRTTPKPYILRRLLAKWPSKQLVYRGMPVTAADFDIPLPTLKTVPLQSELFAILSAIRPEDLKIDVDKTADSRVELKVSIRITR
jgi:transcriptional regulator with XRE-family HTH domain